MTVTFNALHRVIKKGDLATLRNELSSGVSPNLSNRFSWTLLMLAAIEGNTSIGELLVSRGAALDSTNDFGETALSLAAHKGHTPFVRLLLTNRASVDCRPHGFDLEDSLRGTSGVPQDKITLILDLIAGAREQRSGV